MSSELCCVKGCYTNVSKHKDVVLYSFPDSDNERELRSRWIDAVQIANSEKRSWEPHETSRLCSEHFVTNCRSLNPSDINYVPTIFPAVSIKNDYELLIDLDDSEIGSDDSNSEVIEETSDCLFVVGKIKQEPVNEETSNGTRTLKPVAASKRKSSRGSRKKRRILPLSKENGAGSPKRSKVSSHSIAENLSDEISNALFTGKFSSDSSDPDFDADEFEDLLLDEDEESERELTVSDKLKVALKSPSLPGHVDNIDSEEGHLSSDDNVQQKKRSRKKKKKRKPARFNAKGSQAALPGICDGFVFCTTRDDDFNVGVQCNISYEFKLMLPHVEESSTIDDHSDQESIVQC